MKIGGPLIRDLKRNTEILVLAELLRNPSVRRREIAERLGMTEQAISQYISELEKERLLSAERKRAKPTRQGVQVLQERLFGLKQEIESVLRNIRLIDTCVAIASDRIREGQRVGLIMEDGKLRAVPGAGAGSAGVARSDAERDEEVVVGELTGVVELELGRLLVLQLPDEFSGGSRRADRQPALDALVEFHYDEIAIGDLIGDAFAGKIGLHPTISFAPVLSTISALSRGRSAVFLGSRDSVKEMIDEVDRLRRTSGYSIGYRIVDLAQK